jgi:integration host factor subunit alpha
VEISEIASPDAWFGCNHFSRPPRCGRCGSSTGKPLDALEPDVRISRDGTGKPVKSKRRTKTGFINLIANRPLALTFTGSGSDETRLAIVYELSDALYRTKVGLTRNESSALELSSFGTFTVRKKGQRIGRNPETGVVVPSFPRRVRRPYRAFGQLLPNRFHDCRKFPRLDSKFDRFRPVNNVHSPKAALDKV